MQITETENQVAIIEKSITIFQTAPQILQANQLRTQKALSVGNKILDEWTAAWEIEDEETRMAVLAEIDIRSNNYLVKVGTAYNEEKELRAALTQMMDLFRKMFTDAENKIDKTKVGTVPNDVQLQRNKLAKAENDRKERKRQETEQKAAKEKEAIDIRYTMENSYANQFNTYLLERKQKMMTGFNAIILDVFEEKATKLNGLTFSYSFKPQGLYTSQFRFHCDEDLKKFSDWAIQEGEKTFSASFMAEMELLKEDLIEKLPSKKNELLEAKKIADEAEAARIEARRLDDERIEKLATANAAEKKRIEAQQKIDEEKENERLAALKIQQDAAAKEKADREKEENDRLLEEAQKKKEEAELNTDIKKQGEHTMSLFEREASLAEVNAAAEIKKEYEIEVTHPVGYTLIFQLWFQTEGGNMSIEKIGNTKLDQMKAWAEKYAMKTSTKIESKFLKYSEVLKALNKKAK
jgi:hypothetical protein